LKFRTFFLGYLRILGSLDTLRKKKWSGLQISDQKMIWILGSQIKKLSGFWIIEKFIRIMDLQILSNDLTIVRIMLLYLMIIFLIQLDHAHFSSKSFKFKVLLIGQALEWDSILRMPSFIWCVWKSRAYSEQNLTPALFSLCTLQVVFQSMTHCI